MHHGSTPAASTIRLASKSPAASRRLAHGEPIWRVECPEPLDDARGSLSAVEGSERNESKGLPHQRSGALALSTLSTSTPDDAIVVVHVARLHPVLQKTVIGRGSVLVAQGGQFPPLFDEAIWATRPLPSAWPVRDYPASSPRAWQLPPSCAAAHRAISPKNASRCAERSRSVARGHALWVTITRRQGGLM